MDAGAGSGKTRILVERIVDILDRREAALEEITAITFMEKAAAEMKDRLRRAFRGKASAQDITPAELSYWRDLERRVEHMRISTIHSFCASLMRENALRLGLDPDFGVLAEAESVLLTEATLTETLHDLYAKDDPSAMRLAGELSEKPLRSLLQFLLRKRNLLERVARDYPLEDAEALLTRWETEEPRERKRRLAELRSTPAVRRWLKQLAAFDGRCVSVTDGREIWRSTALDALRRILDAGDAAVVRHQLVRIGEKMPKGFKKNWETEESFEQVTLLQKAVKRWAESLLAETRNPAVERAAAELVAAVYTTARTLIEALATAKQKLNALDFDDLIAGALTMLRENDDLRSRTARGIKFLLIDEFQDTDGAQLEIARLLANHESGPGLFIVGDAKQSIFYFRGAEVDVFQEERTRALDIIPLDRNFRSLPDVLDFVNDFFARSRLLDQVENYRPMAAHRARQEDARIEFLFTTRPPDTKSRWPMSEYRRAEAGHVATRIRQLCAGETRVYDEHTDTWRAPHYGDIALLFRSTSNIHLYEGALRNAGIPYTLIGGAGFYTRQEIMDVLNLLRVISDPWDEMALLGFLRGPIAGLSDESLLRLRHAGQLVHVFESTMLPEDFLQTEELTHARNLVTSLRPKSQLPLPSFLRHVLEETGYEAILLAQYLGVQKASNVRKLIDLAQDFARQRPPSLRAFVQYLQKIGSQNVRESEAPLQPEGTGAVTLMTIHKSKGLEFPVVFIPDMAQESIASNKEAVFLHKNLGMSMKVTGDDGLPLLPSMAGLIRDRISEEEEAEEARLLYVALTRARDYLVLCGTDEVKDESWFGAIAREFGVLSAKEGAPVQGAGWRGVVHRPAPMFTRGASASAAPELPDHGVLARRIAPLISAPASRLTFSISSVLDRMAGGFDEEEERGEPETRKPRKDAAWAMSRGTLVHRLFELWDFQTAAAPPLKDLIAEARLGLSRRNAMLEELTGLAERFRASALYPLLAAQRTLRREAPFLLKLGETIISGTIDALLEDGTILDYKTGAMEPSRHARYEWQLLLYAAAVRALCGVTPPRGLLYYVDEDTVHETVITEDQIEDAMREAVLQTAAMRDGK